MTYGESLRSLRKKKDDDDSLWVAHFGGLFNPTHMGHMGVGKTLIEKYSFDKVVYVPGSSHYPKPGLASEAIRLALLEISIKDEPRFETCDYELGKNDWTEPFETLMYLKNKYQQEAENVRMFTIRGDDWLPDMINWVSEIAEHEGSYEFIIVPRTYPHIKDVPANSEVMNIVLRMSYLMEDHEPLNVSSSLVREQIRKRELDGLPVAPGVLDEIQLRGLYM